jgi:hypothetical protein
VSFCQFKEVVLNTELGCVGVSERPIEHSLNLVLHCLVTVARFSVLSVSRKSHKLNPDHWKGAPPSICQHDASPFLSSGSGTDIAATHGCLAFYISSARGSETWKLMSSRLQLLKAEMGCQSRSKARMETPQLCFPTPLPFCRSLSPLLALRLCSLPLTCVPSQFSPTVSQYSLTF